MAKNKAKINFTRNFILIISLMTIFVNFNPYGQLRRVAAQQVIPSNTLIFNPIEMSSNHYKIMDGSSQLRGFGLHTVKWDTYNRYPGISVFVSDPFLTNYDGSVVIETTDGLTDPNGIQGVAYNNNGTLQFIQTFTLAQDIAVRTHSNFPSSKYRTWVYDELVGIELGGGANLQDADGDEPYGVLYAFRRNDRDAADWAGTGTEFTKCLLENSASQSLTRNSYDFGSIANDAFLSEYFGNRDCQVIPRVTLEATDMDLIYNYNIGAGGQGYFSLEQKSMQIGFVNVRQSNDLREYGFISDFEEPDYQIDIGEETSTEDFAGSTTGDDNSHTEGTVQVYFRYSSARDEPLDFEDFIYPSNYLNKDITAQTINQDILATFDYPKTVQYSTTVTMQPQTSVKYATFETQGYYIFKDWTGDDIGSSFITKDIELPYGIKIDNVYTIHRVMTDVIVLSEQSVLWNPAVGDPIVPEDLTAFGINEFGLLPSNIDIGLEVTVPTTWWEDFLTDWDSFIEDPFGFLSGDLFPEVDIALVWGIIIAIIVVVVVIAMLRFIQPRRRQQPQFFAPAPVRQPSGFGAPPPEAPASQPTIIRV